MRIGKLWENEKLHSVELCNLLAYSLSYIATHGQLKQTAAEGQEQEINTAFWKRLFEEDIGLHRRIILKYISEKCIVNM